MTSGQSSKSQDSPEGSNNILLSENIADFVIDENSDIMRIGEVKSLLAGFDKLDENDKSQKLEKLKSLLKTHAHKFQAAKLLDKEPLVTLAEVQSFIDQAKEDNETEKETVYTELYEKVEEELSKYDKIVGILDNLGTKCEELKSDVESKNEDGDNARDKMLEMIKAKNAAQSEINKIDASYLSEPHLKVEDSSAESSYKNILLEMQDFCDNILPALKVTIKTRFIEAIKDIRASFTKTSEAFSKIFSSVETNNVNNTVDSLINDGFKKCKEYKPPKQQHTSRPPLPRGNGGVSGMSPG